MKIIYTDSGVKALEDYKNNQVKQLEEKITSMKYVFGDEVLEITSSDVKQASESKVILTRHTKFFPLMIVLQIYIFIGIALTVGGIFYNQLVEFYKNNPMHLTLVAVGSILSCGSYLLLMRMRVRVRREMEYIHFLESDRKR